MFLGSFLRIYLIYLNDSTCIIGGLKVPEKKSQNNWRIPLLI